MMLNRGILIFSIGQIEEIQIRIAKINLPN